MAVDLSASEKVLDGLRAQGLSDRAMFQVLQKELRRRAAAKMRRERIDHTLQATALVNEAFVKVFADPSRADRWTEEAHAVNAISLAMERILIDHASARCAAKRGGESKHRVPLNQAQAAECFDREQRSKLDEELLVPPEQSEMVLAIRDALEALRSTHPRRAAIVHYQFYAGLTQRDIASLMEVSLETVKKDWASAKEFLRSRLT